jgi:hypothetical protein
VTAWAQDSKWENPEFRSADEAIAVAKSEVQHLGPQSPPALKLFVDLCLAENDVHRRHSSSAYSRKTIGNLLITHNRKFAANDAQNETVRRFENEISGQREVLERRLARFGFPDLSNLVFLRLVDSVDAFSRLGRPSSDKMSQVGGLTYYCRYVVLPLSYVGERSIRELRASAALNPSVDVDDTLRRWQRDSFNSLVNTFRHEMVHVHTNTTLGVPAYSDRIAYPTWFHEGTATYLAADPHAGLSEGYKEYQNLLFYLVQRFGVTRLQAFYAEIFDGNTVRAALRNTYEVSNTEELFTRSRRWHRGKDIAKTGFWISALVLVVAAIRGGERPYFGFLHLLLAVALAAGVLTGLAEHLFGLHGHLVVLAVKTGLSAVVFVVAVLGARRVWRFKNRQLPS